jgi:hypothetical protein
MSTKTTFKRIALVAVAALGFGVLPAVTANADQALSIALSDTSITLVGTDTPTALVAVTVTSDSATVGLSGTEQIKFSVTKVPTTVTATKTLAANRGDLSFQETKGQVSNTDIDWGLFTADTVANSTDGIITAANNSAQNVSSAIASADNATTKKRTYFMAIKGASNFIDQGVYEVSVDLMLNSTDVISRSTIKIDFVTDATTSGAVLTATNTGNWFLGSTPSVANMTVDNNIVGTIRNRDGGKIRSSFTGATPSISAVFKDASTVPVNQVATVTDNGTAEYLYVAADTTATATQTAFANDGNFTVYLGSAFTAAKGPNVLTVRYGLSSATASITMLTKGAATAATAVAVTAVGQATVEPTANNWTLPLTTKTATYTATGATPGSPYVATVTYSNVAAGDQSPVDATPTTVYADANGVVTVTVTNSNPINGATATVALTGFATTQPTNQVITWKKSAASAITVSMNGAYVALKSANTFEATVTDVFGAPVAGVLLTPVVSGSNADVAGRPTVVTGTDGKASITLTDAAAVAAGTDTVKFTEVGTSVTGSSTITYAATAPVVAALTPYYTTTVANAATPTAITTPVPATGIYASAGVKFDLENTRNTAKAVTATNGKQLVIKISAGVAGAAVKAEASTGAYVLNSINFEASSRTRYTDSTGVTVFTVGTHKAGANTVTFTSGSVTTSIAFWGADSTAARFVTLTGPSTLAANGSSGSYVVAVTDRYGNPVNGVSLSIAATGVAVLGGGATLTSFTTDATGTFTFQGTSTVAAGGAGSFKVSAPTSTDFASIAGYVDTTPVNADLAAGSNSATVAVTFTEGANAAEANAQAALDAAAEATDAANAATDAANAAAEAADAATAAAQDAADAVAALSTQVSEMVNALKKQITALTNLVIKIQKKVKA